MFRSVSGHKAQYHHLTLLAVAEFDEWKVLVYAPGVTIHGARQFSESNAKRHALVLAQQWTHEHKKEDLPQLASVDWGPATPDDWVIWRG